MKAIDRPFTKIINGTMQFIIGVDPLSWWRENRQLKQEREILSKAVGWFAQETGTIPKKSSGS